jgi:hypothetical protein
MEIHLLLIWIELNFICRFKKIVLSLCCSSSKTYCMVSEINVLYHAFNICP